jgi:hypothetical protein
MTFFYRSGGWESGGPGRMTTGGGAHSMLSFQLKRRANGTTRCRKMNQRQRAHLGSIGRMCDMTW